MRSTLHRLAALESHAKLNFIWEPLDKLGPAKAHVINAYGCIIQLHACGCTLRETQLMQCAMPDLVSTFAALMANIATASHQQSSGSVNFAGKSTFAQQLASRLNLPNVLQTDIIYEVRSVTLSDGAIAWGTLSISSL